VCCVSFFVVLGCSAVYFPFSGRLAQWNVFISCNQVLIHEHAGNRIDNLGELARSSLSRESCSTAQQQHSTSQHALDGRPRSHTSPCLNLCTLCALRSLFQIAWRFIIVRTWLAVSSPSPATRSILCMSCYRSKQHGRTAVVSACSAWSACSSMALSRTSSVILLPPSQWDVDL
jgi:hypothetical protein